MYLRPYVGQSSQPKYRIPQHTREIVKGSANSLHYYILKNGEGSRSANFIRLWAIASPPRTDGTIKLVVENFLEKVMCRAFQSLPAETLEQTFGPCPQGQYSGTGLNVITPLAQGRSLSPHVKHRVVQLLYQSPDPEIRQWAGIRNNPDHPMGRKFGSDRLPTRQYMDRKGYYNAIRDAIKTSSNVEKAISIQVDEEIWAPFEGALVDPQSWSQSTLVELQRNETTMVAETVSPVGTSEASIGVVFETTPLHDYYDKDAVISVPWGLRESGLQDTNSLIWPFDLRKYTHIPGSFQVTPAPPVNRKILHAATQKLITGSRLRIVIICGCIEDVVIPPHAWAMTLTLNDISYDSWIETRQDKIARIFVRAPVPLSELWASHGRQAFQLSTIFLFMSAVLDVAIFPKFYESALALTLVNGPGLR